MEERNRADNNKTGFTFWKSFKLMINGFTNFSVVPLRLASVMGLMIAIVGFIYGLIVIIRKIVNPDILIGYSSLMAVLLFIGGIIMILLGVIGEYLGRIYVCINKAPQYVVKDTINLYDNEEG
jgi:undecaprenyl-phosphate 4-deoxy-4-formamido-L-arabinose transferase